MTDQIFQTQYLNDYLRMVEDTESPRIFHLWSSLFAVSAALGQRCYFPFGESPMYANLFALLIGTPGTRKSTAMKIAARLLKKSTGIRFAPTDTGFQRQGLAKALLGKERDATELATERVVRAGRVDAMTSVHDFFGAIEEETTLVESQEVASADKHHLIVTADEFTHLIGQGNSAMLDFLVARYDGDPYHYETMQTSLYMERTLMGIIACSTPTSMAQALPAAAVGQGLLSRCIIVYGATKYKKVPRPAPFPDAELTNVKEVLRVAYSDMHGAFEETPAALDLSTQLYEQVLQIHDPRFTYYEERRYTHLIKLAMTICACNGRMTITDSDYAEANRILSATERGMSDALGEFGMNPLAQLKQEILEQLRAAQGALTLNQVVGMFHRDAKSKEIIEVIGDLVRAKTVVMTQGKDGDRYLSAAVRLQTTEEAMMTLLKG